MILNHAIASDTQQKAVLRAWSAVLSRGELDTYARVHQGVPVSAHISAFACRDIMNDLLERGVYPAGAEP